MANLATEKQKQMTRQLCEQLKKEVPGNLEEMSSSEAYELNTRLMQERHASQNKKPIVPKTVNEVVEEELKVKVSGPVSGMCYNNACMDMRMLGKIPSDHGVELLERARKLITIAIELEK